LNFLDSDKTIIAIIKI